VELRPIPLETFITQKDQWPARDTRIVVYCGSGHRSTMALTIFGSYGYKYVSSLKGGFGAWAGAGYPVLGGTAPAGGNPPADVPWNADFQAMLETMEHYNTIKADGLMEELVSDTPPFLLDVRTTAEVEENGHIEGAVHIPLDQLAQNLASLPDFNTPIVTYCGSGWRATIAMTALHGLGWTDVRALKTPFANWVEAGNPVIEGLPEPSMVSNEYEFEPEMVAAFDEMLQTYGVKPFGIITADDLNMALSENPELIVIDVRRPDELADNGVIDTGDVELLTIPLEDLITLKDQWPADENATIIVYCGSGHRSTMALTILGVNGYENISSLKGGFGSWVDAGYPAVEYATP
jgi:rhodanese-related sulfurtransferase